jgi:hypothetical protein
MEHHYDAAEAPPPLRDIHLAKVFWCPYLYFNLLYVSQSLRPRLDLCQLSLESQDAYVVAPQDPRTALFTLMASPASLSPMMTLMGTYQTAKFLALQDQYLKDFQKRTEDPRIDVDKGGLLHPIYVKTL